MDIQFYGANCVTIATKQIRLVFDDNLVALGGKSVAKDGDIYFFTATEASGAVAKAKMTIDLPGEYEVSGVSVHGVQTRSHMDEEADRSAVMYKVTVGDTRILVTGHIFPRLSEAKLEDVGPIDVMIVPVGGNGYTLDGVGAMEVVKQIEPKVVIPTHYADTELHYEVPQQSLEDALKAFSMEPKDPVKKFSFKPGEMTDTIQVVVLEKS